MLNHEAHEGHEDKINRKIAIFKNFVSFVVNMLF